MIISVTAPRHGMGQTITAINLCAMLMKVLQEKTLLIDTNQYCSDIEYYLSDTHNTKGLDDFINLMRSKALDMQLFKTCVKEVLPNMDIMSSNSVCKITEGDIGVLKSYVDALYKVSVIDTVGASNRISREFFDSSDIIVVVINQMRNVVAKLVQDSLYSKYRDKMVYVLNKCVGSGYEGKLSYSIDDIREDLADAGLRAEIFPLEYDSRLVNECNEHSVLNHVVNGRNEGSLYLGQLENLVSHILQAGGLSHAGERSGKQAQGSISRRIPILRFISSEPLSGSK